MRRSVGGLPDRLDALMSCWRGEKMENFFFGIENVLRAFFGVASAVDDGADGDDGDDGDDLEFGVAEWMISIGATGVVGVSWARGIGGGWVAGEDTLVDSGDGSADGSDGSEVCSEVVLADVGEASEATFVDVGVDTGSDEADIGEGGVVSSRPESSGRETCGEGGSEASASDGMVWR